MSTVTQSLHLRQSQNLVMTPQLQQAIKLLQLSNLELREYLENELINNPLLEAEDSHLAPVKEDIRDSYANDRTLASSTVSNANATSPDTILEKTLADEETLRDHLSNQLFMTFPQGRRRAIGLYLIDRLDEQGYLRESVEELAVSLGAKAEEIKSVLEAVKKFEPVGVFAADLSECLALQLEDKGALDAPMRCLLDHLDLLGKGEVKALADKCGVNMTYMQDMVAEIRRLNPRPAGEYEHFTVQTVVPDVHMTPNAKHEGGGWRVELNTQTLPKVLVNQEYYTVVAAQARRDSDKEYLNAQLQSANWLVRAMDQRAQTILKVASAILEEQSAFFLFGIEYLKPMTLNDIAKEIDMHESTVSRVTTNKYIETPRGIFPLKFFFGSGVIGDNGVMHAAESVKSKIKALIETETLKTILSDDALVDLLKVDGIDIARRTVAKYREEAGIGSSVQRRRQKKQQAALSKGG